MANGTPYEMIMAPFTVYIAPVGTAFPDVNDDVDTEGTDWELLGKSGTQNQGEDGVTVQHEQTVEEHRNAGGTGPRKVSRTEESMVVTVPIEDARLETYRVAVNNNATSTDANKKILGLNRGVDVAQHAVLVRGYSPYMDDGSMQYEIPACYEAASPSINYTKGQVASIEFQFRALEDDDATSEEERFGRLIAMEEAAAT